MLVPNPWWETKKGDEKAGKGWEVMQKGGGAGGGRQPLRVLGAGGLYGFYVTCWLRDSQAERCRASLLRLEVSQL